MIEMRHGGLAIDLPEGWSDQSTLLFLGAPTEVEGGRAVSNAVSVRFSLEGIPPEELLTLQARQLTQMDPTFEVLDQGPFECGLGDGWHYVQRVEYDGVMMKQIAMACAVGPVVVIATAAAEDARFEETQPELLGVLRSLRPGDFGGVG